MNAFTWPRRPLTPPAPPIGVRPDRYGNGNIEILIYPSATTADRIAAAVTLLQGTPWRVALDIAEHPARENVDARHG